MCEWLAGPPCWQDQCRCNAVLLPPAIQDKIELSYPHTVGQNTAEETETPPHYEGLHAIGKLQLIYQ